MREAIDVRWSGEMESGLRRSAPSALFFGRRRWTCLFRAPPGMAGPERGLLCGARLVARGYAARAGWRRTSHSSYSDNAKTSAPTITKFAWEVGDTMPRV